MKDTEQIYCSSTPIDNTHTNLCRCGCIPQGIPSLFEMAKKREEYRKKMKEEEKKQKKLSC